MSARYWVLVSDELLRFPDELSWPDGLRMADLGITVMKVPDATWVLAEDDHATPELTARQVELVLRNEDGRTVIAERRLL